MTLDHFAKALDMVRASLDTPKKEETMTTTYTGPTPYDAEINRLEDAYRARTNAKPFTLEDRDLLEAMRLRADGYRLRATEDAPLLEAAKVALPTLHQFHHGLRIPVGVGICEWKPCANLRDAIAQAEGKE